MCQILSHTPLGRFRAKIGDPGIKLTQKVDSAIHGKEAVFGAKQQYVNPQYASQVGLFKAFASKHGLGGAPRPPGG